MCRYVRQVPRQRANLACHIVFNSIPASSSAYAFRWKKRRLRYARSCWLNCRAWIAVDAFSVAWPLWGALALDRIAASLAFASLAIHPFDIGSIRAAYRALGSLIAVPLCFYLLASGMLGQGGADPSSLAAINGYYYLPMIVAAGLSIVPLTALEAIAIVIPILSAMTVATILWPNQLGPLSAVPTIWRLVVIAGISARYDSCCTIAAPAGARMAHRLPPGPIQCLPRQRPMRR
jgi:hypothetical protein